MGKNLIHSFFIAFSTYSKIPMPQAEWDKNNMRYSMCFFPLIGAVIGGVILLWAYLAQVLSLPGGIVTAGYVLIPVILTGGIHLDGYLDTCDALSSYQSRERKLEIMKDSHAGAFAIICGIGYFVLQYGVWDSVSGMALRILPFTFVLSRAFSGLAVVTFPCAKGSGLLAAFSTSAQKKPVKISMITIIVLVSVAMLWMDVVIGSVTVITVLVVFYYYYHMSKKQFGGITGDLAGYFLQIAEVMMALVSIITASVIG